MNKTPIEWCSRSWNPVTGCLHPCRYVYCYNTMKKSAILNRFGAKYINETGRAVYEKVWRSRETGECHVARRGEINPYGFDPTFYPHRLEEPLHEREFQRVFVVDTGDLFGEWVPKEWIEKVLNITRQCMQHTFMLLTKNPQRYADFTFPSNCWCGTTVNSDKDAHRAETLRNIKAPVRYLSIEPLLGEITFQLRDFQWVIIGAMTGKNPVVPETACIERIVSPCRAYQIPLFLKNNLAKYYPEKVQDFPSAA